MAINLKILILYLSIIFSTFFFASLSRSKVYEDHKLSNKGKKFYIIAYLIAAFFYVFTNSGVDYEEYKRIFEVCKIDYKDCWIEPGFAFLNHILGFVFDKAEYAISSIKLITISLVFYSIYSYRGYINIGFAVLFYMIMLYFDAICLIRIHLAAAVIFYGITYFYRKNQWIIPLILCGLSVLIHFSAFMFLVAMALFYLFHKTKLTTKKIFILLFIVVISNLFSMIILRYFLSHIPFLVKYSLKYSVTQNGGIGIMQYVFHAVPIVCLIFSMNSNLCKSQKGQFIVIMSIVCILLSLFISILGYSFEVIARSYVYFMFIWIVTIPLFLQVKKKSKNIIIYKIALILFALYRFYDFMSTQTQGLEKFTFFI